MPAIYSEDDDHRPIRFLPGRNITLAASRPKWRASSANMAISLTLACAGRSREQILGDEIIKANDDSKSIGSMPQNASARMPSLDYCESIISISSVGH